MQQRNASASRSKSLSVSRAMSAPSVEVGDDGVTVRQKLSIFLFKKKSNKQCGLIRKWILHACLTPQVSGFGLALVGVAIEQEASYWEAHVQMEASSHSQEIMFGVSTKKDQRFYKELEDLHEGRKKKKTLEMDSNEL